MGRGRKFEKHLESVLMAGGTRYLGAQVRRVVQGYKITRNVPT